MNKYGEFKKKVPKHSHAKKIAVELFFFRGFGTLMMPALCQAIESIVLPRTVT